MVNYYEMLMQDVRFKEGLNACMNCGVCTAICPAAEFYSYDPRKIVDLVQTENNEEIENLLKSETIWYCGECMSCKTRCPRGNTPALVVMALRTLSQKLGFWERVLRAITTRAGVLPLGHLVLHDIHSPQYQIVSDFKRFSISSLFSVCTRSTIFLGS